MATPTTDKLRIYFASKYLVADGGAITQYTADAGGSVSTIVDAALTQAADYWNGAIGWFDGDTSTAALRGIFFHVEDFDAGTDTLTLSRDLPAAVAAGDTYHLVLGGNYRGATECFGLAVDGDLPELETVSGTNITGLTFKKASLGLGAGTLSLFYDQSEDLLFAKMGAEDYGVGLDVSGDVTDGIVFCSDGQKYVQVDVTNGSLPVGDETDTFTLTIPDNTFTPDYEGYETGGDSVGKTRYRLEVVKNEDGASAMVGLAVYSETPAGTASAVAAGESLTTAEGDFDGDDLSDWPEQRFWIYNADEDDCRFAKYRSGNTLYCAAVDWATLSYDAGSTEIMPGDTIVDGTSGATAVVDQITLDSGDWGTNDAAGTMILKDVSGTFGDGNDIEVSESKCAECDGDSALGLRGKTAVSWDAADVIYPMPDVDLGLDAPNAGQFEGPDAETAAPSGVTFDFYDSSSNTLAIGDLAAGAIYGVWRREWIVSYARARADIDTHTHYLWS